MAGIADKIRLYNEAYQQAWSRLNADTIRNADDSARLDTIIRTLVKDSSLSASDIASEAMQRFANTKNNNA